MGKLQLSIALLCILFASTLADHSRHSRHHGRHNSHIVRHGKLGASNRQAAEATTSCTLDCGGTSGGTTTPEPTTSTPTEGPGGTGDPVGPSGGTPTIFTPTTTIPGETPGTPGESPTTEGITPSVEITTTTTTQGSGGEPTSAPTPSQLPPNSTEGNPETPINPETPAPSTNETQSGCTSINVIISRLAVIEIIFANVQSNAVKLDLFLVFLYSEAASQSRDATIFIGETGGTVSSEFQATIASNLKIIAGGSSEIKVSYGLAALINGDGSFNVVSLTSLITGLGSGGSFSSTRSVSVEAFAGFLVTSVGSVQSQNAETVTQISRTISAVFGFTYESSGGISIGGGNHVNGSVTIENNGTVISHGGIGNIIGGGGGGSGLAGSLTGNGLGGLGNGFTGNGEGGFSYASRNHGQHNRHSDHHHARHHGNEEHKTRHHENHHTRHHENHHTRHHENHHTRHHENHHTRHHENHHTRHQENDAARPSSAPPSGRHGNDEFNTRHHKENNRNGNPHTRHHGNDHMRHGGHVRHADHHAEHKERHGNL